MRKLKLKLKLKRRLPALLIVPPYNSPYMADHFGRKVPIITGCLIMILGAFLSAFTNGDGSKFSFPNTVGLTTNMPI